ncbi:MAG: Fic family protein [Thermoanaerobaculia bacterium]
MIDPGPNAPHDTTEADRLYRGFPDFSAWGSLSPTDHDLWSRFASGLAERRKAATPEALNAAIEVAVRAAALDTGAIEGLYTTDRGFTMTVAVQGLAWEQMIEERGAGVRELFEAQLETYELVLDAVTQKFPITEAWIRTVHETICAPEKTYRVLTEVGWQEQDLPKGQYKTRPNHVRLTDGSFHAYSPVDRVPDEMHRLLEQIRTPEFDIAHPVLQASYIHYAFVVIHPFADGNGRVARALASVFFYRAESIPLVIFSNQRPAYLDALATADREDYGEVISFFLDRGIDTMQLVVEGLMTAEGPKPEDLVSKLNFAIPKPPRFSSEEIANIEIRLVKEIASALEARLHLLELSNCFLLRSNLPATNPPAGYFTAGSFHSHEFWLRREFSNASANLTFSIWFNESSRFPFLIRSDNDLDRLEVRIEDVSPELTPHLLLRLDHWIQRQLSRMLADLARQGA